jgi:acyl-homoserine-lactone acylase
VSRQREPKSKVTMNKLTLVVTAGMLIMPGGNGDPDRARWERMAANVTITRDDWGIAHVHGGTDSDAVFGMMYAQAEDDFNRIETNYLNAMGRLAEAEGERAIMRDLRMKLFINPDTLKAMYGRSPDWLKTLMGAWADGLNFYLAEHPEVKPRVITRFEPWMALSFSEGSIGGDIETVDTAQLRAFYLPTPTARPAPQPAPNPTLPPVERGDGIPPEPTGSNGFAIAPSNTANHKSLLLINPHTSFFFRSELQVTSEEGLNVYGAATWGQFFIYQGFNERTGWMHTSSGVDNIDEYLEAVVKRGSRHYYRRGTELRPFRTATIRVPYKVGGRMAEKRFTVYYSEHGPVVRRVASKWVTVSLMNKPVEALTQSFSRTRSRNYQEFRRSMELFSNSSNNTVFADAEGNIAYFHSNFLPRRDTSFDWTKPVDGSNPATDWKGLHAIDESPNLLNPATGWLYNANDWPWDAAGPNSPKREDYPRYVERGGPSARGRHAVMVLEKKKGFTLASLIEAAYDSYLPWFEKTLPRLTAAYDSAPASHRLKTKLAAPIEALRHWDLRWSVNSIPASLAVFWGEALVRGHPEIQRRRGLTVEEEYIATTLSSADLLRGLSRAVDRLTADFGTWRTPWGNINRFQRLTGDIVHPFDDAKPSIPVGFTSARWGSLASFGVDPKSTRTKKRYGTGGNSFVAVVEFGDSVRARAVTAGGESGYPESPHFNDQAERYATGNLREVYFYPSQLIGHTEREYHPGD